MTAGQLPLSHDGELNQGTFDDFVARLKHHCRGKGVADHCTADALFIVQKRVIISGISEEYADKLLVHHDEQEWFSPKDYYDDLDDDEKYIIDETPYNEIRCPFLERDTNEQWDILRELIDHIVTGWREDWEYVNAHFTQEAADAFIARKKHDYRHGIRVFVDSQYWCWEFKAIVNALMDGKLVLKDA